MENAYAQALWKMLQNGPSDGRQGMKPKEALHALHESLMRSGRQGLLPKIGRAFAKIAERDQARTNIVLTVAREKDEHTAQKEAKDILSKMNIDSVDVTGRVDDSLIGGWRLEGRERLVDASFKKQLLTLYNRATRS